MAVAVVYGLYIFLYSSGSKTGAPSPEKRTKDLNKFVIDVANKITDNSQSKNDEYIVAKASAEWPQNPFIAPTSTVNAEMKPIVPETSEAKEQFQQIDLAYTGYLNIGDSSLSIINGKEYKVGDPLEKTGYFLKRIFPTWVEIGIKNEFDTIILPLEKARKRPMEKTIEDSFDDQKESR
jgi:hypothetical protein